MKTMHNARLVLSDRLSDLCQAPCNEFDSAELLISRRLHLLMSIYGCNLSAIVLLVGREPKFHIHNHTVKTIAI